MEGPDLFFPELSPIENNLLEKHYVDDEGQAILVISLDIGDGRKDEIKVYENDNSDQLAIDFCYKHKLGAKAKLLLAEEIEKYFKIALSRSLALSISNQIPPPLNPNPPGSHNGRSQTFTQRSMQVNQNILKLQHQNPPPDSSTSLYTPTIRRLSPSKLNQASSSLQSSLNNIEKSKNRNQSQYSIQSSLKPQNSSINSKSISTTESKTSFKSAKIMKKIKYSRYKEIFDALCPNSQAFISPETIQRSRVPGAIRKLIAPLIEELEELDETLNFHEFYDAMETLMQVLTPGDKSLLLLNNKKSAQGPTESTSMTRARAGAICNRNLSSSSLYNRNLQRKQEFSKKLTKTRESFQSELIKESKFTATISSVHRHPGSSKKLKS